MTSGEQDPPYDVGIDHLKLTETHRRSDLIQYGIHTLSKKQLDEIIDSLSGIYSRNGTKRSLTQLTSHAFLIAYVLDKQSEAETGPRLRRDAISEKEDPGLPPRVVEYGLGLGLQDKLDNTESEPFIDIADHLLGVLSWFSRAHDAITPSLLGEERSKLKAAHSLLFRQLSSRRFVDGRQHLEKAYRAYKPFETEMMDLLGFDIEDVIYYLDGIAELVVDRSSEAAKEQIRYTDSLLDIEGEVYRIAEDKLWVDQKTLEDYCDDSDRFENLLNRLASSPGCVREYRYPTEVNPLRIHPIIEYDGEYLLPMPGILPFSISHTFYYDLIDTDIGGEFGDSLGTYLEEWAVECLNKLFPSDEVMASATYSLNGGDAESDIVILHGSTLLVIECKSKKLRAETQKGEFGGIEAIEGDIEQSVGEGYAQANRLIRGIQNGSVTSLTAPDSTSTPISPDDFDTSLRCIVLGESFDSIATQDFARFLNLEPTPYVLDIFDLQMITHVLETPEQLLEYVIGRIKLIERQTNRARYYYPTDIHSPDEIDYLAFFKQQGMEFRALQRDIMGAGDSLREHCVTEMVESNEMRYFVEY